MTQRTIYRHRHVPICRESSVAPYKSNHDETHKITHHRGYKTPMHGDMFQQDKICTSHVERMNGSIRLFIKRLNRLTYAFSKKVGQPPRGTGLDLLSLKLLPEAQQLEGPHPGDGAWPLDRSLERAENVGNVGGSLAGCLSSQAQPVVGWPNA